MPPVERGARDPQQIKRLLGQQMRPFDRVGDFQLLGRRPLGRLLRIISLSSQISSDPRFLRAAFAIVLEPMARQWLTSWTSWLCGRGRVMACSCGVSNRMDSQCESPAIRFVQQRLRDVTNRRLASCRADHFCQKFHLAESTSASEAK